MTIPTRSGPRRTTYMHIGLLAAIVLLGTLSGFHDMISSPYSSPDGAALSATEHVEASAIAWSVSTRQVIALALCTLFSTTLGMLAAVACRRRAPLESELERAIRNEEFEAWLQPIVRADDGRWIGAELLARWRHPRAGLIGPDRFIPAAERSGQIARITSALIRQLQDALPARLPRRDTPLLISINACAVQFADRTLVDDARTFLDAFPPNRLTLQIELTEREQIAPDDMTIRILTELRDLGVSLAIDDFGTGHASFAYLQQFPVDTIKVDRRFVSPVESDPLSRHLVDSMAALAETLKLHIVAEGVENDAQRRYLLQRGVIAQQGYLFGKPMPLADFLERLGSSRACPISTTFDSSPRNVMETH
jgi:c-di-GMP-specific phosphodiesterase